MNCSHDLMLHFYTQEEASMRMAQAPQLHGNDALFSLQSNDAMKQV